MNEEGLCAGCGRDCLDIVECGCGREEIRACEECRETDIDLVCGGCRDRAVRAVLVGAYPCLDFVDDEAGAGRDPWGRLPVRAPIGAWGAPYRAG